MDLTDLEREALAQTGKAYDLRRSSVPGMDRARFIKAFDALVQARHLERVTLPDVLRVVEQYRPALPAPKEPAQLPTESTPVDMTDDDGRVIVKHHHCHCGKFFMGSDFCPDCGAMQGGAL